MRVRPDARWTTVADSTAVEEPLQVCVDGVPFAVVMRTPGDDADLVAGFLLAESVIGAWDDVAALEPAADEHGQPRHNVIDVRRTERARTERGMVARAVTTSAACGLCGRQYIASLGVTARPVSATWQVGAEIVQALPDRVSREQHRFHLTGGLHAAALFDRDGVIHAVAEDVGRHNAVDKIVGRQLREGAFPVAERGLFVSGRVAFEIVQKALVSGIGLIAAVSAPSSLAVELARASGITLIGFLRERRFNVYSHPERLALGAEGP